MKGRKKKKKGRDCHLLIVPPHAWTPSAGPDRSQAPDLAASPVWGTGTHALRSAALSKGQISRKLVWVQSGDSDLGSAVGGVGNPGEK